MTVARFRVESLIGAGGTAVVFRARDEAVRRVVALKVLARPLADDDEFRERFLRESAAAAALNHPCIIPVYDSGQADGVLYVAMRLVAGGGLSAALSRAGPFTADRAAFMLSQLASALDAAHASSLVHCGVRPENILIDTSTDRPGHSYLSDFGLAHGLASPVGLTLSGWSQFPSRPGYCAPEQIAGGPAGPQADQYSLACVAFTMLSIR
jgi:serine/threonine-protein kinase